MVICMFLNYAQGPTPHSVCFASRLNSLYPSAKSDYSTLVLHVVLSYMHIWSMNTIIQTGSYFMTALLHDWLPTGGVIIAKLDDLEKQDDNEALEPPDPPR
jgi:hypothetical protein